MTGQLLVFAGSLAGVGLLILISRALDLGRNARITDEKEARELADNAVCGFEARAITLDARGRGALLADAQGRIMLLAPHGAHFAARLLDRSTRTAREDSHLTVEGATLELGDDAGAWEKRIASLNS